MVERVAVLSDVHGVLPALVAVLAEPEVASADEIILTGDIAAGPQPVATLDLLTSLGERVVWVRGNADRELVAVARGEIAESGFSISDWAAHQLRPDQVALLAGLPTTVERSLPGLGRTVFCHATPRDDEEVVLVDSALPRWAEVYADLDEDVTTVVCGHTHMPFVRMVAGRTVVNPGSVGMPYSGAGAHWALLGGESRISLRRTRFDLDAACAQIVAESGYPQAGEFADTYVRARFGDAQALTTFAPRDGRAEAQSPA
jgi:predicted phosphodiesterase